MYIGKAARLSGTTVKSIRHYEKIGLLPLAPRVGAYRVYDQETIDVLRFIKCAQQLGFRLKELQGILGDSRGRDFPWERIQQHIERKKQELRMQIDTLQQMHAGLQNFERDLQEAREECHLLRTPSLPEQQALHAPNREQGRRPTDIRPDGSEGERLTLQTISRMQDGIVAPQ